MSDPLTLTIVVPRTPPSKLLPNAARRTSFHVKADLSRPLRELARWEAIKQAMAIRSVNGGAVFAGPVRVRVKVFWERGRRRPDCDGLGLAVKAMQDGLGDALIFSDDRQIVEACYGQEKTNDPQGWTEFVIEEVLS